MSKENKNSLINRISEGIKALPEKIGEKVSELAKKAGTGFLSWLKKLPGRIKKAAYLFCRFCFRHAAVLSIILAGVLGTGILLLIPLKVFYKDRLFLNTYIDSVYTAGYDRERVISMLSENFEEKKIKVIFEDYETEIRLVDYVEMYDFSGPVDMLFEAQSQIPFYKSFAVKKYHVIPQMVLKQAIKDKWAELTRDKINREYYYYYSSKDGCFVYNDSLGHVFDADKAFDDFLSACLNDKDYVDLSGAGYFYDIEPSETQLMRMDEFERIDNYQNAGISYDMGDETITLSPAQMCSFLVMEGGYPLVNENGRYVIDEDKICAFAEVLFEPYNTIAKNREFRTVKGTMILTNSADYGTEINMRAEDNYLIYAVKRAVSGDTDIEPRVPVYNITANNRGLNDIGMDYIEVDVEHQKLYLVSGGECELEADIVTGKDGYETPSGLFSVNDIQNDRFLVQYNYNVFVNYMIELSNGLYITDALWREEFGTDGYHETGSYGNIELRNSDAETVFKAASEGMPVIVYGEREIIEE